jgi:hypothetical protein
MTSALHPAPGLSEQIAGAKYSDQADDDQVKGDDIVQQARHDKNKNAGDQRDQRSKNCMTYMEVHGDTLS